MSSEIKEAISQCSVCAEFQPRNPKEPMKKQFSRHGIPDILASVNGPQLVSHEFKRFAEEWEFKNVMSSPHHHKANGKAESAVKVTKNLFKKDLRDGRDPRLALLEYRNTPVETI